MTPAYIKFQNSDALADAMEESHPFSWLASRNIQFGVLCFAPAQVATRIAVLETRLNYTMDHKTPLRTKVALINELKVLRAVIA